MNQKKEEPKVETKYKIVQKNGKSNLLNTNTNSNNTNNITINNSNNNEIKKSPKTIKSSKDSRQYNVQLTILDETKQLKINLEIMEGQKPKTVYIKTLKLDQLISLNNFFSQFKDYSDAFDFLLKNFTKIDRSKITYSNGNNDITIILLFSLGEKDNDIIEDSIQITLHKYTGNKINKSLSNITQVINNLKASLEKFNLSIKELKAYVNKEKIEKDKRINDLEQIFHNKLSEIKQEIVEKNRIGDETENLENKFEEIYNKIEEQNYNIGDLKKNIEENDINQKNEINKNNKIFIEKENELAKLITEKFNDFLNKINSYDEKNIEMENNFNDKLNDLDNKTNIWFNELIKKINSKNSGNNFQDSELQEQLNETINNLVEENENLERRLENKIEEKINEIMISKIKNLENKINVLETNIGQKKEEENNTLNEHMNIFDSLVKEKFDDFEKYKNILSNNFEKINTDINENKINIQKTNEQLNKINDTHNENDKAKNDFENEINEKINEIYQNKNTNKNVENVIENIKKEIEEKINNIKEENKNNLEDIKVKLKIDLGKEFNYKFEETKKELNTSINNLNELLSNNIKDLNNKIQSSKQDILLNLKEKNKQNEASINKSNTKQASKEIKIERTQPNNNQIYFDNNITTNIETKIKRVDKTEQRAKIQEEKKYSSKTVETNKKSSKKIEKQSSNKNNILSKTLPEIIISENSDSNNKAEKTDKDSENSLTKKNMRNSYFISSYNLFSSQLREKVNVFELNIDSKILNTEEISENFFIFKKLKEIYAYNRYIKLNLIYRASRDGDLAKDFHFKCDFIGPNLTLIKTKKDFVFGGFTIKTWKHLFKDINNDDPECGTELKDEQAFGFSLNLNKIYENGKQDESIIYCNSNYGPCFKNFFFKIFDRCFENGGICGIGDESNFIGIEEDFEINGGEQKFDVDEIEVFQIAFR